MTHTSQTPTLTPLRSPLLGGLANLEHGFFTRNGGLSQGAYASLNIGYGLGDDEDTVTRNWSRIAAFFQINPAQLLRIEQVHSAKVIDVDSLNIDFAALDPQGPPPTQTLQADGLFTFSNRLALCIRTADCVPLLIANAHGPGIAAVHAGWRGLASGIIAETARLFADHGIAAQNLRVAIGPHIGACCYQVGPEVLDALGPDSGQQRGEHLYADQAQVARRQWQDVGVAKHHIAHVGPCVSCAEGQFFSHRRDKGQTGRQASVIVRLP